MSAQDLIANAILAYSEATGPDKAAEAIKLQDVYTK